MRKQKRQRIHPGKAVAAITAILQTPNLGRAADMCGINLRTLQRWMRRADFLEQLNRAKETLIRAKIDQLATWAEGDDQAGLDPLVIGKLLALIEAHAQICFVATLGTDWSDLRGQLEVYGADWAAFPIRGPAGSGYFVFATEDPGGRYDRTIMNGPQANALAQRALRFGGRSIKVSEGWAAKKDQHYRRLNRQT